MADNSACRTRQETAVAWAASHAGELAGVAVPLAGGVVVSPWLCLLSAGVAGVWARHEVRVARRARAARRVAAAPRLTGDAAPAQSSEIAPGTGRPHRREVSR